MSSYTPDEEEFISCYADAMNTWALESHDEATADAKRGIAKLKADALREAADRILSIPSKVSYQTVTDEADRIERESNE